MTARPWQTNNEREPLRGPLIRALLEYRDRLDPWFLFPQHHCAFSFGAEGRPMPIGALCLLWDGASEFVGICPRCGEDGYGWAAAGGLAVGGVIGACTDARCNSQLWRPLGGLATLGRILTPHLQATPYSLKTGSLGGTFGADGQELLAQLRLLGARV